MRIVLLLQCLLRCTHTHEQTVAGLQPRLDVRILSKLGGAAPPTTGASTRPATTGASAPSSPDTTTTCAGGQEVWLKHQATCTKTLK